MAPTNLLLVDYEQSFVEIMTQRLRRRGFIVAYAFSGQEALNRLEADDSIDERQGVKSAFDSCWREIGDIHGILSF